MRRAGEKNMNESVYLTINELVLEKIKKEAKEESIANQGKIDGENSLYFGSLPWTLDDVALEDGTLRLGGNIKVDSLGEDLGYISISAQLDLELIAEIVEYYVKKLNRLKTVLEATTAK